MPDGKQPCASCPHPFAEHGDAACKVPGCTCAGFSTVAEEAQTASTPARHTLVGRATDAVGDEGIELKLPNCEGNPLSVSESVIAGFGAEIQAHYERIFKEPPKHVGVTAVPYLASADTPMAEDGPVLMIGEGTPPEEIVKTLKTIEELGLPVESLPPNQKLAYYLKDISAEDAAKAINGQYAEAEAQAKLTVRLAQMDDEGAYTLAARLRNGDFLDG